MSIMTQMLRNSERDGSTGLKLSIKADVGITKFGGHRRVVTTLLEGLILSYDDQTVEIRNKTTVAESAEDIPFARVALSSLLNDDTPRALLDFFGRVARDGSPISIEKCDNIKAVATTVVMKYHETWQAEERRREDGARARVTNPGFQQFTMMFLALRNVWISGAEHPVDERAHMGRVDAAVLELMILMQETAMIHAEQTWLVHSAPTHYKEKKIVSIIIHLHIALVIIYMRKMLSNVILCCRPSLWVVPRS